MVDAARRRRDVLAPPARGLGAERTRFAAGASVTRPAGAGRPAAARARGSIPSARLKAPYSAARRRVVVVAGRCARRTARMQDVLRRVLARHQLDERDVVARQAEEVRADGVRCVGREPLAQQAVCEEGRQLAARDLARELVLAARDGEDHSRVPAHRSIERLVRRGVACVQAHDEMRRRVRRRGLRSRPPRSVGRRPPAARRARCTPRPRPP